MRIMGLDYGSKTVGVAVCDPLGITAQAVKTAPQTAEEAEAPKDGEVTEEQQNKQ